MSDERAGVLGSLVLISEGQTSDIQDLKAEIGKNRREIRRLTFEVRLEMVCILFLTIGMGILARR